MPKIDAAAPQNRVIYHHGNLKRALVDAALALVREEQDWGFSLREVARRAGVSHNAPYNHFADKRDLLIAVAVAGYEALRERLETAAGDGEPDAALIAIGTAYVRFGIDNPAHYRLMFSSALATADAGLPSAVTDAATAAKNVLLDVVGQGGSSGQFSVHEAGVTQAALCAWSLVHGLTMLTLDGLAGLDPEPRQLDAAIGVIISPIIVGIGKP